MSGCANGGGVAAMRAPSGRRFASSAVPASSESQRRWRAESDQEKLYLRRPHSHAGNRRNRAPGRRRVLVTMDDTVVLGTVVARRTPKPGQDFFPLTVDYVEKTYAAGKIPGGFFKREGRPSEKETLTSRLIDRPIRPLFPDGFYNEVQVVATVMSVQSGSRSRHPGDDRRLRRAGASPACRSTARSAPRASATSTASTCSTRRPPQLKDIEAQPGRRRHRARRADGRIRSAGTVRRRHARRGGVRPRADAGRDQRHQRTGRR